MIFFTRSNLRESITKATTGQLNRIDRLWVVYQSIFLMWMDLKSSLSGMENTPGQFAQIDPVLYVNTVFMNHRGDLFIERVLFEIEVELISVHDLQQRSDFTGYPSDGHHWLFCGA